MKKLSIITLICLTGCTTMRRHPVAYGVLIGASAGVAIGLATRHTCPSMINDYPYEGTPPCPNPKTYDPGEKGSVRK
ncbi:MAG TPA: hypothetical protein VI386_17805 [Candidatus Sulfotelmatobacter sp.]